MAVYDVFLKNGYTDSSILYMEHEGQGDKVDFDARKKTVVKKFSELASILNYKDKLVIYIQGMGRLINEQMYLRLTGSNSWDAERNKLNLSGTEFGDLLKNIKARKILLIETCNSRGWIPYLQDDKSVLMVSCDSNQVSYGQFSAALITELGMGIEKRSIKSIYHDIQKRYAAENEENRRLRNFFGPPVRFFYSDPGNNGKNLTVAAKT